MIHSGHPLKKLLLISLSLKDDKKELLGKTSSLCSIWISNQRDSKERKDSEPLSLMYYPNSSKRKEKGGNCFLKLTGTSLPRNPEH